MEKAKLAILQGEVNQQEQQIQRIYLKIKARAGSLNSEVKIESLAYQLHNLYCAYEDLFKVIADTFENNIEEGITWHKELLRRMSITIKGIRPNLISEESLHLLSELRAFRHFFRHAYGYELDARRIKPILEKVQRLKSIFKKDLVSFMNSLKKNN